MARVTKLITMMMHRASTFHNLLFLLLLLYHTTNQCIAATFLLPKPTSRSPKPTHPPSTTLHAEPSSHPSSSSTIITPDNLTHLRSPLKYIGPYPCLSLRFPHLATPSQRSKNITGISLDFVVDTAANTNTIQFTVARELSLGKIGTALPGVGAAGVIRGGDTFFLGDCELDDLILDNNDDEVERFTFMKGLTASALPIASPAAAGLLSISFLNSFSGGVEFAWGGGDGMQRPSFGYFGFYEKEEEFWKASEGLKRVPIRRLPRIGLPEVTLRVNGVGVPALLDTGSPVTVINAAAAKAAGIPPPPLRKSKPFNPFSSMTNLKQSQQDVLIVAGTRGEEVQLRRTVNPVEIGLSGGDGEEDIVGFGEDVRIYVGDLPGLAVLGGLGDKAPPAAILGTDLMRRKERLLYRATEVYL